MMRGAVLESFQGALILIGYTRCRQDGLEWRRQQFHLFVRKTKRGLVLNIHEDLPSSFPPFHHAKHKGKNLEGELRKIVEAYQRVRSAPKNTFKRD